MTGKALNLITGIHHPNVGTTDYPTALNFFHEVFGMRMVAWYLMHGSKDSDHALIAYGDERNSGFFSLCNRPEMNKLTPVPGLTSPTGQSDTVAPGAMQSISFHVASEEDLNAARAHIEAKGYSVSDIEDRGYEKSFSLKGPHEMLFRIAVDGGVRTGQRDLIDMEAANELGLSEAEVLAAMSPSPEPDEYIATPNPDFYDSKYRFGLTKDTAFIPHLPINLLNWLMTETIPADQSRSLKAIVSNLKKMAVALPRILLLKLQGKLRVTQ
ncbi:VOC family protein [Nitratireductor sp. XY-223]|uniref:VOC family protein n=1 Tax=Nitratireductor sp. XY-223 TaxID=2561926 RepID=UPI0010AB334E|nr:VOC family protein [Nitratireductor sp. XY-223]